MANTNDYVTIFDDGYHDFSIFQILYYTDKKMKKIKKYSYLKQIDDNEYNDAKILFDKVYEGFNDEE